MPKQILKDLEAIKALESGCEKLTCVVASTLGPKGRNVVLERKYTSPLITNDGVTIAKEITLEDTFENVGASIIKEASIKTNDVAGDGTTTACVLANSIVKNGMRNYIAGANPIILRKGMSKAVDVVVDTLKQMSKEISSSRDIFQVASISAQDEQIGELISNAFENVGKEGVITVEESNTTTTSLKLVEGMQYDKGYLSIYMCNNMEKMEANYNNCDIYLTDNKITTINDILPVLEYATKSGNPMLIVCDDIENEPLTTIVLNKMHGNLNVVVTKAPAYGDKRSAYLDDISALVGATLVSEKTGTTIKDFVPTFLGKANIKVTKDNTTITNGQGSKEEIAKRVSIILAQIKSANSDFDKKQLEERLAKLTGGVAVIMVGAMTEIEMQEKKLRIEDAISATKSAISEGIVCGGGIALLRTAHNVMALSNTLQGDEKTGAQIIYNSLFEPIKKICENAGVDGSVVIDKILNNKNASYGYDALTNTYCDMFEKGIIDPTKVTRSAIENACSVASTLLTTSAVVCEKETQTISK